MRVYVPLPEIAKTIMTRSLFSICVQILAQVTNSSFRSNAYPSQFCLQLIIRR